MIRITGKVDAAATCAKLNFLLLLMRRPEKFFKAWGTVVAREARRNARNKGGKKLWKSIADSVVLRSVWTGGAVVECMSYIGTHKELGGPIEAKNKEALTIPIHLMAEGKTVSEMKLEGYDIFRPRGSNVLCTKLGKQENTISLYALCKRTKSQEPDPWWPDDQWALRAGEKEAVNYFFKDLK